MNEDMKETLPLPLVDAVHGEALEARIGLLTPPRVKVILYAYRDIRTLQTFLDSRPEWSLISICNMGDTANGEKMLLLAFQDYENDRELIYS